VRAGLKSGESSGQPWRCALLLTARASGLSPRNATELLAQGRLACVPSECGILLKPHIHLRRMCFDLGSQVLGVAGRAVKEFELLQKGEVCDEVNAFLGELQASKCL
jgi:hypothetical protein